VTVLTLRRVRYHFVVTGPTSRLTDDAARGRMNPVTPDDRASLPRALSVKWTAVLPCAFP
jgi:hypothetical protein